MQPLDDCHVQGCCISLERGKAVVVPVDEISVAKDARRSRSRESSRMLLIQRWLIGRSTQAFVRGTKPVTDGGPKPWQSGCGKYGNPDKAEQGGNQTDGSPIDC